MISWEQKFKNVIIACGGVARTADFNKAGYSNFTVAEMCNYGVIVRLRNGHYALPTGKLGEEAGIAQLYPDGIVCMESALFYYGYSDKVSSDWHLAFTRTVTRSRFKDKYPVVRCHMVQENILALGVEEGDWDGVKMKIYDRERTICDCFKRRSRMSSDYFAKAVNAYVADDKKRLANLPVYAKKLHVYWPVIELMEILLIADEAAVSLLKH